MRRLTFVFASALLWASPALAQEHSARELIVQGGQLLVAAKHDEALPLLRRATELEPGNALAWAHLGLALAYNKQFTEAGVALDKAAALDGRNTVVHRMLGVVASLQGDPAAAVVSFDRVIELDPDDALAWAHRAIVQQSLARPYEALADSAEAIRRGVVIPDIYAARAFALMSLGRREEAEAEIDALLAANPDDPRALSMATALYSNFGFTEKATGLVDRARDRPLDPMELMSRAQSRGPAEDEARLADLDEALRLRADFLPALHARGTLRYRRGDIEGALADVARAIEIDPQQTELYLLQASIARAGGRPETGLAAADALTAANPASSYAHVAAGKIYAAFGSRERALAAIDRAIEITPLPYLYVNRSEVRDPTDYEGRLADIEEALRLAPNFWAGLVAKAELMSENGDLVAAARHYTEALAFLGDDPALITKRAIALSRLGQERESERDFARARSLATDAASLNTICYEKAKSAVALDRALEECNESLRLAPDSPATLDSRGLVRLQMGRFDEAIADFDQVLEKTPGMATTLFGRAVAWSRKGDMAKARTDERAALAADPEIAGRMAKYGLALEAVPET